MAAKENHYFIITEKPEYPGHVNVGSICYTPGYRYRSVVRRCPSPSKLPVILFNSHSSLDYDILLTCMKPLSEKEAELLLALPDDAERLKWFTDKAALQTALGLTEGTAVIVEEGGEELKGIIRYIGELTTPTFSDRLSGTFFGIELQGPDKGKGKTDGSYQYQTLFTCAKDCGIFAPFSRVRPVVPRSLSPSVPETSPQLQTDELIPGDRVTYLINDKCHHGMVLDVQEVDGQHFVQISTDTDQNGKRGGEVRVPLDSVMKGEVPAEPESMDIDTPPVEPNTDDLYTGLTVNSVVEVTLGKGNAYGIIRWIGNLTDRKQLMAGLELEDDSGVSDGTFKNERYFSCLPKRALFVKLSSCRPDSRFQSLSTNHNEEMPKPDDTDIETDHNTGKLETVPPLSAEQVNQILIGRMKGIQGHCNSCYMDAALFSLFSCSSVLDSMLFKSTAPQDAPIQRTLLHDIVNPLRRCFYVFLPAATACLVLSSLVSQCVCVSSWQNMILEAPAVAGTSTEVVFSILTGVYMSVSLWTDFVTAVVSQLCS